MLAPVIGGATIYSDTIRLQIITREYSNDAGFSALIAMDAEFPFGASTPLKIIPEPPNENLCFRDESRQPHVHQQQAMACT